MGLVLQKNDSDPEIPGFR